jgi:hypothetical protein
MRSSTVLLAALAAVTWSLLAGCAPARHYEAALVLHDLAAGDGPSRLKRTTPTPLRETVSYLVDGRARRADLYLPGPLEGCRTPGARPSARCPRAALVAVPGAVPRANRDPRFTAFTATLARAGFAVLAPEMSGFRELRVRPHDAREIADAFHHASSRPELAPGGRAGLFAFSYAVGPAVLAALADDIRDRVRFIVALGGYHDLPRAIRFFTTGWYEHEGTRHYLAPDDTGRMVLALSSLEYLRQPGDELVFECMVELRMREPAADLAPLAAQLSQPGQAVYTLAVNTDPARFPALLEGLPEAMRADLERLNVARSDLKQLKARLWLVHGRNDNLIPCTETLALAAAAPEGRARVFLIHRVVGHVDLAVSDILTWRFWTEDLPDLWRLWRMIDLLLAERGS